MVTELPYRLLWEGIADAVVVIDERNTIRYANSAVHEVFGLESEDVLGMPLATLLPERMRDAQDGKLAHMLETGLEPSDRHALETVGLHRDGRKFPLEISFSRIEIEGCRMFAALLRDTSSRKRAEEDLRAAVSQLSATLDSTNDGIVVVGNDNRMTRFNRRFAEMWNIPRQVLDTRDDATALALVFDQLSEPARFWTPIEALKTQTLAESFDVLRLQDGRVYERYSRPQIEDGVAIGRVWSFRDITERERAARTQAALHKISEAAHSAPDLEGLFQAIHAIVGELLPAENFYVSLYDKALDTISFPYWVDEVDTRPLPRKLSERRGLTGVVIESGEPLLLSPDTIGAVAARPDVKVIGSRGVDWLGVPLKTSRGILGVLTVQNYSGTARYTEKDKELLQFVSHQVAAAVERKQAQQAVQESEDQFKSAFEYSAIGMALVGIEGNYLKVNSCLCAIAGYSEEELLRSSFQDITHPDDLDADLAYLRELLAGDVQSYTMEKRYVRRDGSLVPVFLAVSLVKDTAGRPKHFIAQVQDITERKRAEQWQQHYADTLGLITAEAPTGVVLESLASFAEGQADALLCSILRLSPDGKRLLHGAAPSLPAFYNQAIDGTGIGPDIGSCGAAAFTGCLVISEDVMLDPNWAPWRELAQQAGVRSCWSQPILSSANKVLGTFAIYHREPATPRAQDLELIRQSAGLAAVVLERAQDHEDQRLAKVVFEQSLEGIMVTDLENRVLMVNQAFESLTGFSAAEVVGHPPAFLDSQRDSPKLEAARRDSLARSGRWQGDLWGRKKSGEGYPLAMSIATVKDAAGSPSHFISIITDVSEQKIQAARIEQLAFYDSLTGLPNRALFLDRLEHTLLASKRHGGHGAILFLDLDRFKDINDTQGHAVGDLALAEVARRLKGGVRREETLARLGGDEFVLIAENADAESAVRIAARLQRSLAEPLNLLGHAYTVRASIGIAFYPADGQSSEDLIKHTDIAMYRAKASGGGYRLYQAEMGAQLEKRLTLAKRLSHALENGKLQLYYQPQIDLNTGQVIGAEALLRWNDPELGWISPAEFIPIAEERGMMGPLGDWVLREGCRQINAWTAAGLRLGGRLAINVSALQIEDPDVVERLLGIVREANLSPERFELELTESSMMLDPERAVEVLEALGAAGFGLSIDDFGTGYSSLAYLKRFAADQIKIDISFVRNMLTDFNDHAIVTTIIAMARSLGLKTTAEGVEELAQATALLSLGCDHAQGYHFGRPEPAQSFSERWLRPPTLA